MFCKLLASMSTFPSRSYLGTVLLSAFLCSVVITSKATVISDDFNRADSSVIGNGWTTSAGSVVGNPKIVSNRLANDALGDSPSGIFQPLAFTTPLQVQATLTPTDGDASVPAGSRFIHTFFVKSDGSVTGGYGVTFYRADSVFNNSAVRLVDNNAIIDTIASPFQFLSTLAVNFVVELDGSVHGSATEGSNVFNFNFGPHAMVSSGSNFEALLGGRGGSTSPSQTIDNLVVNSVPEPAGLALVAASACVVMARRRRRQTNAVALTAEIRVD